MIPLKEFFDKEQVCLQRVAIRNNFCSQGDSDPIEIRPFGQFISLNTPSELSLSLF